MGRRVIKGRKSIAYYDHDGYKQFVFDANDTYGDGRYQRPILPLKHLLIGLDELNGTNTFEDSRSDYRKIHNGIYTYLEKQNELTGDEQYDRLFAEGIAYSLYCKTGFPKTQNIHLRGLPYSYRKMRVRQGTVYPLGAFSGRDRGSLSEQAAGSRSHRRY